MTGYLTNTKLSNKERCEYASRVSGFNVEFRNHPMPKDFSDYEMEHYNPYSLEGLYGSIYTNEDFGIDHSPFWRAWDNYTDKNPA